MSIRRNPSILVLPVKLILWECYTTVVFLLIFLVWTNLKTSFYATMVVAVCFLRCCCHAILINHIIDSFSALLNICRTFFITVPLSNISSAQTRYFLFQVLQLFCFSSSQKITNQTDLFEKQTSKASEPGWIFHSRCSCLYRMRIISWSGTLTGLHVSFILWNEFSWSFNIKKRSRILPSLIRFSFKWLLGADWFSSPRFESFLSNLSRSLNTEQVRGN